MVSTLARLSAGNMRFGGRFSAHSSSGFARVFESTHVRSFLSRSRVPVSAVARAHARDLVTTAYELRCRECGRTFGVQPLSICDECFSPLEVAFDLDYARTRFTREKISHGPANMWRYRALLPVTDDYTPQTPSGFTP